MKKMRNFWFILGAFLLTAPSLKAQPGKFGTGPDSLECRQKLSFYSEYYKQGDYVSAVPPWRRVLAICPRTAAQGPFLDGQTIIKNYLMRQPGMTSQRQSELIDSLFLMYDMRIEYYPANRVNALQNKIREMSNFLPDAKEARLVELEKLFNLTGDNTLTEMLTLYMGLVGSLYVEEKRTAEDVMDSYSKVMTILESQERSKPDDETIKESKKIVEDMLIGSGVATCENLIALFTPRFEANPDDLELVSKIVSLLSGSNCDNSDLYLKTVTALNKLSPSYKTAFYLYRLHLANGDNNEAAKFLREAINSPDISATEKGEYLYNEALLYYRNFNNINRAMTSAKAAIDASPSVRGKAFILIATIWTRFSCGETDIEKRAPYWVAVDYLTRAKAADPSSAAEADRLIAQYRQNFPSQEETFMYDLMEGSEYTVTCGGYTEKTTVRTRR